MQQVMAEQLLDLWMNDSTFRERMRRDPVGTARDAGIELDEMDRMALESIDWSLSDEELAERLSKRCC